MGKRSNFIRNERDYYKTPYEAVVPLIPHLNPNLFSYGEPCAGDGTLIEHLNSFGLMCTWASDIEPQGEYINTMDILNPTHELKYTKQFITNPPWDRKILHPTIDYLRKMAPTWLLFDSDWMFTKQASGYRQPTNYLKYCHKIVSVGRVKWFPDSNNTGKDNCAWYLFKDHEGVTEFFGPQIKTG